MLTLDNLNIYFISNIFEKECNLTEPHYGTKYCKEKINITEEEINSYKNKHIFDYPPVNDLIPKNFDILPPPEKINKYPEKIKSHKNIEVWHLQDTIFKIPKVYAIAQFITPEDLCNFSEIKNRILSTLFDALITIELSEFIYMTQLTGVDFDHSFHIDKSHISFIGYNDSLKKCLKHFFELIKNLNINNERCKEIIELEQKDFLRRTKNIFLIESFQLYLKYESGLLFQPSKEPKETINFFKENKITIEDLIKYKNALFKNSKIKWLIQGNISKEEALEIAEEVNKIFEIDIEQEKIGKFFSSKPVVITKNYNYIYKWKSSNPNETNSSLVSIYQTDLLNTKEIQYFKLIESFLANKFFDQLRTKETLGYIVQLTSSHNYGYYNLENIIQSNSKTPEYCASRVRNFYKESYKKIKDITEEEFKKHLNARINVINKKDKNLFENFSLNWIVINDDTYEFDIIEKTLKSLNECNREEFIKFYEKYFINEVAILDSELLYDAHYEQNKKDLKETKILEGENIKKRIICDNIEDFKACNQLGVNFNNPIFKENNN